MYIVYAFSKSAFMKLEDKLHVYRHVHDVLCTYTVQIIETIHQLGDEPY